MGNIIKVFHQSVGLTYNHQIQMHYYWPNMQVLHVPCHILTALAATRITLLHSGVCISIMYLAPCQ